MATIEDTLRMREELIKSIEEHKLALANSLIGYDKIFPHSASALANINPISQMIAAHSASALVNLDPKIQEALELNAAALTHTRLIFQEFLDQNNSACSHINSVFQDISSDYKLFNEAGLFPKWQDLPNFMDLSSIYDDEKIEHSDSKLTNLKNISDPDSKRIFQKVKSISEAIQYDNIIRTPTKRKKIFKRKVSIRNAHAIRQRYKNKQFKSLYKSLLSYSLNKLDVKTTPFFIGVIEYVKDLPIPENLKIYFSIMLVPLLFRMYYLITHSDALAEKTNNPREEVK